MINTLIFIVPLLCLASEYWYQMHWILQAWYLNVIINNGKIDTPTLWNGKTVCVPQIYLDTDLINMMNSWNAVCIVPIYATGF